MSFGGEEQFVPLVSQADIAAQLGNLPGSVGSVGRIIKKMQARDRGRQ